MSDNVKTGFIVILITLGIAAVLGIALYFYQPGPNGKVTGTSDNRIAACEDAKNPETHWRLVTGSVPSPTTKWQVYSTKGVICHVVNSSIRTFAIDEKELKRTGCTAGDYALYCLDNSQPERHPLYQAIMNP